MNFQFLPVSLESRIFLITSLLLMVPLFFYAVRCASGCFLVRRAGKKLVTILAVFDHLEEGVLLLDLQGNVIFKNRRAEIFLETELYEKSNVFNIFRQFEVSDWFRIMDSLNRGKMNSVSEEVVSQSGKVRMSAKIMKLDLEDGYKVCILLSDLSEKVAAEKMIDESEGKYRALIEAADDAIFGLDCNGIFVTANRNAVQAVGCNPVGKRLDEVFPLDEAFKKKRSIEEMFSDGSQKMVVDAETTTVKGIRYYNTTLSPVRDRNQQISYILGISRDVTDQKNSEIRLKELVEELNCANENLKTLDIMKNNLLSNVSHELRTPLVAIKGYTSIISAGGSGDVTPRQKEQLEIIMKNICRLETIIRNLLDFSRIELNREELIIEEIAAKEFFDEITSAFYPRISGRNLEFITESAEPDFIFKGDREKLFQVFFNLLDNAFKFTPEAGKIWFSIQFDGEVIFTVRDTGPGVPDSLKKKVFERFYQIDSSATRRFGGMGIGLSICEKVVEMHRGNISISDHPEGGAVFMVRIPGEYTCV